MWCQSNLKPQTSPDYTHLDLNFLDLNPTTKPESAILSLAQLLESSRNNIHAHCIFLVN